MMREFQGKLEPDDRVYELDRVIEQRDPRLLSIMEKLGQADVLRYWHDQLPIEFRSTALFGQYIMMVRILVNKDVHYDGEQHFLHIPVKDGSLLTITEETVKLYRRK